MNIPEEMAKLRTTLTAMGVHWYDDTETFPMIGMDISIYRLSVIMLGVKQKQQQKNIGFYEDLQIGMNI